MSMSFRFKEATGVVAALEVRNPAGSASFEDLYRLLLEMRVQLVRASELEVAGRVVFELGVCELDGGKLGPARRHSILEELASRAGAPSEHTAPPKSENRSKPLRAA
ncbi:MAG TPA: hypothetical protein VH062_21920 [Polyangiaceae bacterium]|jgi:hypothetical protein|nr:hypothetical protein [Polyangiaceae bacterium]